MVIDKILFFCFLGVFNDWPQTHAGLAGSLIRDLPPFPRMLENLQSVENPESNPAVTILKNV